MARDWYSNAVGAIGGAISGGTSTPQTTRRREAIGVGSSPFAGASRQKSQASPFQQRRNVGGNSPFLSYRSQQLGGKSPFGRSQVGNAIGARHPLDVFAQNSYTKQYDAQQGAYGNPYAAVAGYTGGGGAVAQDPSFGQFSQDPSVYNEIAMAAQKMGIPANLLQAVIARESSGNWAGNKNSVASVRGGKPIFGYIGAFHDAVQSWGYNPAQLEGNRYLQIEALAKGLRGFFDKSPGKSWDQAISMHFAGTWQPTSYVDELGNNDSAYVNQVLGWWHNLDSKTGGATNPYQAGQPQGTGQAGQVISTALSYVGKVPYVWGGIPGKGQTPTGWDCSGFTYWLDQNYGNGTLKMGSHYQYDQATKDGTFINDMSQLAPGDLIFFDTGNYAGGGAELNRAGHVGMYIGNGQMVHAANPSDGTIVSNLAGYASMFIGGKRMGWSGASPSGQGFYGSGQLGYGQPQQSYNAAPYYRRSLEDIIAGWQNRF